jgi:hypothetical protein
MGQDGTRSSSSTGQGWCHGASEGKGKSLMGFEFT